MIQGQRGKLVAKGGRHVRCALVDSTPGRDRMWGWFGFGESSGMTIDSLCTKWVCTAFLAFLVICAVAVPAGAELTPLPEPLEPDYEEGVEMEQLESEDEDWKGVPIAGYELYCDLELCADRDMVERFKAMSGIEVGKPYRDAYVERAQMRLAKTGFFQELTVERRREQEGIYIEIEATGAVLIRRIEFEGVRPPPFESDLRKVLMYRRGQVFTDNPDQERAQRRSLLALFEREGYFGTEIQMRPRGVQGDPHLVDLIFEIEPGAGRRVCGFGFRGIRAMTSAEARELMLTGVSLISRRIPLRLPVYTSEQFRAGREALIAEYRRRGYFRARIVDQAVKEDVRTGCVELLVDVNEGPHWAIEFHGADSIAHDRLRRGMPFAETGYVDDEEIRVAEHAVRQTYEAEGFPFAQVRGREEVYDRLDRALIFEVTEGPRAHIGELRFTGMEAFDEEEVLAEFGTRPFGLFDTGGVLQTEQLLRDFARLERRYREHGYMQAVVDGFEVLLSDDGEEIAIEISVNEGRRTQVAAVEIEGNEVLATRHIRPILDMGAGTAFVAVKVQADQSRLSQRYGSMGYAEARVMTSCRDSSGTEVPCRAPRLPDGCERSNFDVLVEEGCRWVEGETPRWKCDRFTDDESCVFENGVVDDRVFIRHEIEEGLRVQVGEVLLKGNFRTRPGVIFRELPLETGDWMDVQKLIEGQGNMRSLGIFDSVSIETIGLDADEYDLEQGRPGSNSEGEMETQVASLIISVEEASARFVDFRFGFEGRELLDEQRLFLATGELQYTDRNLFGTGQQFRPRIIAATDTLELFRLGSGGPRDVDAAQSSSGLDYLFGAELIYTHPRFLRSQFGVDQLHLTVTPFYLVDLLGVTRERHLLREEWGLRLELRKELEELMDRLYLTMGFEAKQAATWTRGDLRRGGDRLFSPRRATGKVVSELTLDRRDSPLNPSEGYRVRFTPELVSGDALAQDGEDLIDDSYWRLTLTVNHFLNFFGDLTLGQGVEVGQVVPVFDRQRLVPEDERYYLGGVGSVRGFGANSLGPVGSHQQPEGGEFLLNYNAELRYPLVADWSLYGATFFDAGILVNCQDDEGGRSSAQCYGNAFPSGSPLGEVRASAGLGLRYLIVDQIPLLLDYGMVLNRRPGERFGSLHFNIGYTF